MKLLQVLQDLHVLMLLLRSNVRGQGHRLFKFVKFTVLALKLHAIEETNHISFLLKTCMF